MRIDIPQIRMFAAVVLAFAPLVQDGQAQTYIDDGVLGVTPSFADPGDTLTVVMQLDSAATPPVPPSPGLPSQVRIGSVSGGSITRTGYIVSASFSIPAGQPSGFYDVEVWFTPPGKTNVYRKTSTFRVTPPGLSPVYVDADNTGGTHDGTSWATAFQTVQEGIDAASAASSGAVWVAEGTYTPTATTDRTASIAMASYVALYGGFSGVESLLSERDPVTHVTRLSGDIGILANTADNSYHVVIGAPAAILDGFVVSGGHADGTGQFRNGGGVYCDGKVSPAIVGCTFENNTAHEGGGIYAYDASSPVFTDCAFTGNDADRGGALLLRNACSSTFSNCTFNTNSATWGGGAIYADYGSSPVFSACSFTGNSTTGKGGAFFTDNLASQVGTSSPVFSNCTFSTNQATYRGGAIYNFDSSETTVSNSTLSNNMAGTGGGAIASDLNAVLTESGNTYTGNTSTTGSADVDVLTTIPFPP